MVQRHQRVVPKAVSTAVFETSQHQNDADDNKHLCTLTTQCSLDRWPRFLQQAESWAGPVSVAVYIPAPQHTAAADACLQLLSSWAAGHAAAHPQQRLHVAALFADCFVKEGASVLRAAGISNLHPLANEQHSSTQQPSAQAQAPLAAAAPQGSCLSDSPIPYEQLYPINALRNVALQHASTPLVLPVDADFLFSAGLEQLLHRPQPGYSILADAAVAAAASGAKAHSLSIVKQLLHNHQHQPQQPLMLVLPALQLVLPPSSNQQHQQQQHEQQQETAEREQGTVPDDVRIAIPSTKAELLQALQEGRVREFDCGVFAPQQQLLDLAAWCTSQEPLELQYADNFEVHGGVAVKGPQLPQYCEDFRGYGLNKQQHAYHAAALGYRFKVLPDAFMVTAPHKRSSSWRPVAGTAADTQHLKRISTVYEAFKRRLGQQGLRPRGLV